MTPIHHALVLNLHQPSGHLEDLLAHREAEAREILLALDRIPRALWEYDDVARIHLAASGTLLEILSSPRFQERAYRVVDCGALLWHLQNRHIIDVLGTGYYHPVLPLVPPPDRDEQVLRWRGIARHLFWREDFQGFWPPDLGFSMELIPLLRRHGYRYVVVDSDRVEPVDPMGWQELCYRPHVARHGGDEIAVVVRDRELAEAQEAGMDYPEFEREVGQRTRGCEFAPLVITGAAGDRGRFCSTDPGAGFWSGFYHPLLEQARGPDPAVVPQFIHHYLDRYGARGEVTVGNEADAGRADWTATAEQGEALARVARVSRSIHDARWQAGQRTPAEPGVHGLLEEAMWHLLRAEASDNFHTEAPGAVRCHEDLDIAEAALERALAAAAGGRG